MKKNTKVFIFLLIISIYGVTSAMAQEEFSSKNVAYWYDIHSNVLINHKAIFQKDSIVIYLSLTFNQEENPVENYRLYYKVTKGYDNLSKTDQADSLHWSEKLIGKTGNQYYLRFAVSKASDDRVIVLELIRKSPIRIYYYDINIDENANYSNDGLLLVNASTNLPIIKSYLNTGIPIKINSETDPASNIFGYYYDRDFEEAIPPMITEERPVGKNLTVDSTFVFTTDQTLSLTKQGLYFFQRDTASLNGIAIRIENEYYPLCRTMSEVLPPLIYISTQEETQAIRNAPDPRAAFEKYWLELTLNESKAKATIKNYYDQVESANFLFTNYKEGWKTDMGMIYIIYGNPDEVYKNEETIEWVYNRDITLPIIRFSFIKVKNIFSTDHYTLLRKKNYDRHWFRSVELWREGKK